MNRKTISILLTLLWLLPLGLIPQGDYVKDEFLIRYKKSASQKTTLQQNLKATTAKRLKTKDVELWTAQFPLTIDGKSIADPAALAKHYEGHPDILIEPNFYYGIDGSTSTLTTTPNDPAFYLQWGLHNTGQYGGPPDKDIDAPEAWDNCTSAANIRVAIIDTGVDWGHEDLVDNIWQNLAEDKDGDGTVLEWNGSQWIFDPDDLDGIDDDGNGYIDDLVGWDFVNNDNNPFDDHSHGTHVAGIVGAKGDNGIGVTGVAWEVQLVPLKFLGANSFGSNADAMAAIEYAVMMGFEVLNNSWGGSNYSQILDDAVAETANAGQLFLAAAGNNNGNDNDQTPIYPGSFTYDNIITVAATNDLDELTGFSNIGATSVDLAAPGENSYSTTPFNNYGMKDGTSMATPMVAGAAALLWASSPTATSLDIKNRLLATVDPIPALGGKVLTGGRLNIFNAVDGFAAPAFSYTTTGLGVTFQALDAATGTVYTWDFGDGNTGTASTVSHSYAAAGNYTVCMIAVSGCASGNVCEVVMVEVENASICYARIFENPQGIMTGFWKMNYITGELDYNLYINTTNIPYYTKSFYYKPKNENLHVLLSNSDLNSEGISLIKLDENGNILWSNKVNSGSERRFYFVPRNSDTINIGGRHANGNEDLALLRISPEGDVLSAKVWNYGGDDETTSAISDGNGQTWLIRKYGNGFFLTHFDLDGNLIWNKRYTANSPVHPVTMVKTADEGYLVLYKRNNYGNSGIVVKIKQDLSVEWTKEYFLGNNGYPNAIYSHECGDFYVVGKFDEKSQILKLSESGDVIWFKYFVDETGIPLNIGNPAFEKLENDEIHLSVTYSNDKRLFLRTDTSFNNACLASQTVTTSNLIVISSNYTPTSYAPTYAVSPISITATKFTNFNTSPLCATSCDEICITTSTFTYQAPTCGPSPIIFTNTSTDAISYEWQVDGDSISSNTDFTHDFPAIGDYVVTLIASDGGNCTSSYSQTISILPSASDLELGPDQTVCVDTIELSTGLEDMAFYFWDKDGSAIGQGPNITATESGIYSVSLIDRCGVAASDVITLNFTTDCVFPGDFDYNGIVNNMDALAFGTGFSSTGPLRPNATTDFTGQACQDWPQTQINNANYKHIDATGDGLIDLDDPDVITANYGRTHDGVVPTNFQTPPLDNLLNMEVSGIAPTFLEDGSLVTIGISLDHPLDFDIGVYGIALSMEYAGNRATADFSNSSLGTEGVDIMGMYHDNTGQQIDITVVGIDQQLSIGNGEICKVATEVNIISGEPNSSLLVNIFNVRAILVDGSEMPMAGFQGYLTFPNEGSGDLSTAENQTGTVSFPVFARQDPYSCGSFADATVTAFGLEPHSYLWDNGATGATALDLSLGWHKVSITDATGALTVAQVEIVPKSDFDLGIAATASSPGSSDGSIQVIAENSTESYPFNYKWNTGDNGSSSLEGLPAGQYIVSVSNGAACRKTTIVNIQEAGILLDAKVYLDGPMNYSTGLMRATLATGNNLPFISPFGDGEVLNIAQKNNVVDWIQVELRDDANEAGILTTALLLRDGSITGMDALNSLRINASQGDYYILVHHRNHLSVRTELVSLGGGSNVVDLSTATLSGIGAAKVVNGINYLWSGDNNQDTVIDSADRSAAWNDRNQSGYLPSDFNLDGVVDSADRAIAWNHRNNTVQY